MGACLGLAVVAVPPPVTAAPSGALDVTTSLAPVAPDGLTASAVTDFIVGLATVDADVEGIGMKTVTLPEEFVNQGELPVVEDGSARVRLIANADGRPVGRVVVSPPSGADDWALTSSGPAVEALAFLTEYETATLRAVLETDPISAAPTKFNSTSSTAI